MYTVSDAVEMGNAREVILNSVKEPGQIDDLEPVSFETGEYFDE